MNLSVAEKIFYVLVCFGLAGVVTAAALHVRRWAAKRRNAILFGGGCFGGTMMLLLTILKSIGVF